MLWRDGVSINHFINLALAEKVAVLENAGYLQEQAARGDVDAALAVLDKAADQGPLTAHEKWRSAAR